LAEKVKGYPDIVIAKMDATDNEHPLMPVTGFPTIRLFKPNDTNPVDYSGDRSLADLLNFLETNYGKKIESAPVSEEL
jgi:protein disulfide-isomerase A1